MELIHALRFDQGTKLLRAAFVGAGGKTTAIFQCARQLAGPVFVTATSHLSSDQLAFADQHYFLDDAIFEHLERELPAGMTLLTGPFEGDSNRTLGVSADQMERIRTLADLHQIPLLIEADGSRQLPLKAPAAHEPPIPDFVNRVIVVAGISGLGKPLTSEWVHRPEIFTSLSGLQMGEIITPAALSQVITYPGGGLKNIPSKARRIVLLNQADSAELQVQAVEMKSKLIPLFEAMIISSLNPPSTIHAVHEPVAAVILAAGKSLRFGNPKQLLDWHGKPFIWHVANTALQAGLDPVIIVCGAEMEALQRVLSDLPVEFIFNPDWQRGQGTSVRLGTQVVGLRSGAILFMLADQPQIPIRLLRSLVEAHAQKLNPITGPLVDGQRANPVLFDQSTFKALLSLSGEVGGRQLFSKYPVNWIPWYDPLPLFDIDTPEDYQRFLELGI